VTIYRPILIIANPPCRALPPPSKGSVPPALFPIACFGKGVTSCAGFTCNSPLLPHEGLSGRPFVAILSSPLPAWLRRSRHPKWLVEIGPN
jgi:hypothetical protein